MRQEPRTLISPSFEASKLDAPTVDDLIDVFEDRTLGWVLKPADFMMATPGLEITGFGISLAYFEGIWSYIQCLDSNNRSRDFFRGGFVDVFRSSGAPEILLERAAGVLYADARCGFFHDTMFRDRIYFSAWYGKPIAIMVPLVNGAPDPAGEIDAMVIYPKEYAQYLMGHFSKFVARLRDSANAELRANFEAFCRHQWDLGGPPRNIVL